MGNMDFLGTGVLGGENRVNAGDWGFGLGENRVKY